MDEVKKPKKPMIYYYAVVMLAVMLLNLFAVPALNAKEVKEVDYATFMKATENHEISEVQVEENKILYKLKSDEDQVYKTGLMDDPGLTERLYSSGATFSSKITEQVSPWIG